AAIIIVNGRNLDLVKSVRVVLNGNPVDEIKASLDRAWPSVKKVSIQAGSQAKISETCVLQFLDSKKSVVFTSKADQFRIKISPATVVSAEKKVLAPEKAVYTPTQVLPVSTDPCANPPAVSTDTFIGPDAMKWGNSVKWALVWPASSVEGLFDLTISGLSVGIPALFDGIRNTMTIGSTDKTSGCQEFTIKSTGLGWNSTQGDIQLQVTSKRRFNNQITAQKVLTVQDVCTEFVPTLKITPSSVSAGQAATAEVNLTCPAVKTVQLSLHAFYTEGSNAGASQSGVFVETSWPGIEAGQKRVSFPVTTSAGALLGGKRSYQIRLQATSQGAQTNIWSSSCPSAPLEVEYYTIENALTVTRRLANGTPVFFWDEAFTFTTRLDRPFETGHLTLHPPSFEVVGDGPGIGVDPQEVDLESRISSTRPWQSNPADVEVQPGQQTVNWNYPLRSSVASSMPYLYRFSLPYGPYTQRPLTLKSGSQTFVIALRPSNLQFSFDYYTDPESSPPSTYLPVPVLLGGQTVNLYLYGYGSATWEGYKVSLHIDPSGTASHILNTAHIPAEAVLRPMFNHLQQPPGKQLMATIPINFTQGIEQSGNLKIIANVEVTGETLAHSINIMPPSSTSINMPAEIRGGSQLYVDFYSSGVTPFRKTKVSIQSSDPNVVPSRPEFEQVWPFNSSTRIYLQTAQVAQEVGVTLTFNLPNETVQKSVVVKP
ncbi:hypothetical protein JW906_09695, partial [bacterium]|nr:hypothetical protein [bacterium]